jgi:hypothetical protein
MRVGLDTEGRACVTVHGASWMERSERCVVRGDSEMGGEGDGRGKLGDGVWRGGVVLGMSILFGAVESTRKTKTAWYIQ